MSISATQGAYNWAVTAALDRALAGNVVGYAFSVTNRRRPVLERYYGYARAPWEQVDAAIPVTPDTRMFIASMSKPITAFTLAVFIEKWNAINEVISVFGRDLSQWPAPAAALDASLTFVNSVADHGGPIDMTSRYTDLVGAFLQNPIGNGVDQVTLQNLLEHKSGIGYGSAPYDTNDSSWSSNFWQWASTELGNPAANPPGTISRYDNRNYVLLRGMIEGAQRVSFPQFALRNVLHPAGCVSISMVNDDPTPARYYRRLSGGRRPVRPQLPSDGIDFEYDNTGVCGAYGWYASVRELTYFLDYVARYTPSRETRVEVSQFVGWETQPLSFGTAYGHNGAWGWGSGTSGGGSNGAYFILPDLTCAALLINGESEDAQGLLLAALQGVQPYIEQPDSQSFLAPMVRNPIYYGNVTYTTDGSTPSPISNACASDQPFPQSTQNGKMSVFDGATAVTGPVSFSASTQAERPADVVSDMPGLRSILINGALTPGTDQSRHVPDIPNLPVVGVSRTPDTDVAAQNNHADFAYTWLGYVDAPQAGPYVFHAQSDDGLILWLDNTLILDDDGEHGAGDTPIDSLPVRLQAGKHPIRIGYFQRLWSASLALSWTRPDGITEPVAANRYSHHRTHR